MFKDRKNHLSNYSRIRSSLPRIPTHPQIFPSFPNLIGDVPETFSWLFLTCTPNGFLWSLWSVPLEYFHIEKQDYSLLDISISDLWLVTEVSTLSDPWGVWQESLNSHHQPYVPCDQIDPRTVVTVNVINHLILISRHWDFWHWFLDNGWGR